MRAINAGIYHSHNRVGTPHSNVPRSWSVDILWTPLFGRKEWVVRCEEELVDVVWLRIPHACHSLKLSNRVNDGGGLSKTDGDGVQLLDLPGDRPVDGSDHAMDIGRRQDADHDLLRHVIRKPGV